MILDLFQNICFCAKCMNDVIEDDKKKFVSFGSLFNCIQLNTEESLVA